MKINTEPVRGTSDYLPSEMRVREHVRSVILNSYKRYGFMQVGTPILEDANLLLGSDGGDNVKLIFKVLKRGEKLDLTKPNLTERDIIDIGLRYDLTVPLVRMFSNNQGKLPVPFKSIQVDYSFRADRPQKGRSRQFIQCDIDILGDPTINAEIDILNTTAKTFVNLDFNEFVIKINDRRILSSLVAYAGFAKDSEPDVCICLDKMDKLSKDELCSEMLSRGYKKENIDKLLSAIEKIKTGGLVETLNYGADPVVVAEAQTVLDSVNTLAGKNAKYKAVYDVSIVRGQGYYTGLVYEVYIDGFRGACGGGGRYNNMVEKMTGKSVPAVGFGLGFEPTCMLYAERHSGQTSKTIAVLYGAQDNITDVLKFIEGFEAGIVGSAIMQKKNIGFQLESLKANGFTHFCKFGENIIKEI